MREAVIASAVRTPLGSFNGSLRSIGATTLQAFLVYLFQATAMGAFGAAVGVVLGLGILADSGLSPENRPTGDDPAL